MEKRKISILVSLIIGVVFFAGFVAIWMYVFSLIDFKEVSFSNFRNVFQSLEQEWARDAVLFYALAIIITLSGLLGLILNILAWLKHKEKFVLISGILYIAGLNPISAIICLVEHLNIKFGFKTKLLLYTALFSLLFVILLIALVMLMVPADPDYTGGNPFVYFIIAISIGVVFNFLAWKTDKKAFKIIAGIVYILGVFSIPSAVICFISGRTKKQAAV